MYDPSSYRLIAGRLDNPERYWFSYFPKWHEKPEVHETSSMPTFIYDAAGKLLAELSRPPRPSSTGQFFPPIPHAYPTGRHVALGMATPIVEAAVLARTTEKLTSDLRSSGGEEVLLLLHFLLMTTTYFIPVPAGKCTSIRASWPAISR